MGLVQNILCDRPEKSHQNACHLLEGTICHLLKHCGDDKGRFYNCTFDFDISAVLPPLQSFAWQHKWFALPVLLLGPLMVGLAVVPELL